MNKLLLLISFLWATASFAGNVSVRDFGARGDGVTLDTEAVQAAIDHAASLGGGVVCVPEGTYLCGSIWLRSNIEFHLDAGAVIKGSPDINDYCAADCCPQNEAEIGHGDFMSGGHLLLGVGVRNVTLSGPGRIDGNSDAFIIDAEGKPYKKKSSIPARPGQMVWFVDSRDISIKNLELADAPYWSCFILNCENVFINGCYVHTRRKDYHTFNGDGIDIDRSVNVTITNCRIDTSDDCITLRASSAHLLENPRDCAMVIVTGCHLSSSCNAIRVGVGEGHIHDAVFSSITVSDTATAFNIVASYTPGSPGTDIDGIVFKDILVDAKELLRIHHMRSKDATIKDITFENISGTAPDDSHIWAKKAAPFRNIELRDIKVPASFECVHASVKVKDGEFKKRTLPRSERMLRRDYIENETKLLY
ncbi:MAG: right-handed parallel beta-helix repeat-containing protein [Bacteroidales bacterium]|nr:right-handed parallel beta-helix repeat-containing protein [Bacteroidales bacterium]